MRIIDRLGRLVAHALEARELALGLLEDVLGHLGLGDLRAVLLDDRALVLAELLADRLQLAAEDVLALLLLDAGLDVLLDAAAHLHECEALALQLERQLEALAHVDGLEQLHLLLEGQVGRVAGGVGERAGLGDRADEGRDAAVVAAQLEDLLDGRAVLALELADAAVGGLLVGPLLDLDEETSLRVGGRRARDAAVQAVQRDRATAAGETNAVGDLGDGADLRVLVLVLGHEQHALLVADVDGEGHVHVGEDDDVFQRDEEQADRVLAHDSRFRIECHSWFRNCTDSGKGCVEARQLCVPISAFDAPEPLQRQRGDAAGEAIRGPRDAVRAVRHDACDEDASLPEDEPRVVACRRDPARLVEHVDLAVALGPSRRASAGRVRGR